MEFISHSEKETAEFAHSLIDQLQPGDIVTLIGDLGSGKTTFVKAVAECLGIKKPVTSPTFTYLKIYSVPASSSLRVKQLIHVDCYRFSSIDDAYSIGLHELIQDPQSIMFIEWPERISGLLPENTVKLIFGYVDENTRKITRA